MVGGKISVITSEIALQLHGVIGRNHDGYVEPERRHLGDMRAGDAAERAGDDVGAVLQEARLHAG